jgi:hypothetical protein
MQRCATNRLCGSFTLFAKLSMLTSPRLRHDHNVRELEAALKFRLLFGENGASFGLLDQRGNALLDCVRWTSAFTSSGVAPAAIKSIISSYDSVALICCSTSQHSAEFKRRCLWTRNDVSAPWLVTG